MLTAAWLGQGTVYFLIRKPGLADLLTRGLLIASVLAATAVYLAPVHAAAFQARVPVSSQYQAVMDRTGPMILLTILLNIYGTLTPVGGVPWSAWLFSRKRVLLNRVAGNIFSAVGALLPASAGSFIRLDLGD